jgi:NAD(P)-dependent dehydrogenase (short-subunit alcohol dehydrogenase family)
MPHSIPRWSRPTASPVRRLAASIWRQASRSLRAPDTPRLDGKIALVTGGNAGIGFETSRGLVRRGAQVLIACRNRSKAEEACERLARQASATDRPRHVPLDLADLRSVRGAVDAVEEATGGRSIDVLVGNAGIWPARHAVSSQGHEIAFATNVLGHFALVGELGARGRLRDARVVVVTGDIYIRVRECSADFRYRGRLGGQDAYARSKLGNVWFARELARRRPRLTVVVVHPGVVASNLVAGFGGLKRRLLLDCEQGAQTSLLAAAQPDLPSGCYLHNTLGLVPWLREDPGSNDEKARALWELCERLAEEFVSSVPSGASPGGSGEGREGPSAPWASAAASRPGDPIE